MNLRCVYDLVYNFWIFFPDEIWAAIHSEGLEPRFQTAPMWVILRTPGSMGSGVKVWVRFRVGVGVGWPRSRSVLPRTLVGHDQPGLQYLFPAVLFLVIVSARGGGSLLVF